MNQHELALPRRTSLLNFGLLVAAAAVLLGLACSASEKSQAVALVNGRPIPAADLAAALPLDVDSGIAGESTRLKVLERLIEKELFVQEAERLGLDEEIAYQLEMNQKGLISQELYNTVVAAGDRVTELELAAAHRMLQSESHLKMIEVESEELGRKIVADLANGTPFETLAVRHSTDRSARFGGDLGYLPDFTIQEPMRSAVQVLNKNEHTDPTSVAQGYQIMLLVDRRSTEPQPPPLGEMKQELKLRVRQQQRRRLANQYLADLRARLAFNPEGLAILCKPADSITDQEQEVWVAVRDNEKYVKVSRLLHVVRRFPPGIDTAMRNYTIRREIEEDLLYDEALQRGLDKLPEVQKKLADNRRGLLYQELFRREVTDVTEVTDEEIRGYYEGHQENYVSSDFAEVAQLIRNRLFVSRRDSLSAEYRKQLRANADVKIDETILRSIKRDRGNGGR